jgi:hypothetical protein
MNELTLLVADAAAWGRAHRGLAAVLALAAAVLPVVLTRAATTALAGWRHTRLAEHARQVLITPPPVVEPGGAEVFWATLSELLAASPARRLVWGNPHVAVEYRWAGRRLTIWCWVPGPVPARLVAAAARAAWPGATTTVEDSVPPVPVGGRVRVRGSRRRSPDLLAEGGVLAPRLPAGYPLRADHDADPLRPLIQAAAQLGGDQAACVQVLARPATPRQVARLRRHARALRTGQPSTRHGSLQPTGMLAALLVGGLLRPILDLATPGTGRHRSSSSTAGRAASGGDPVRDRDARAAVDAAVQPLWEAAVRYAVTHTNSRQVDPAHLRPRLVTHADGIASAFGVYTARNRLRRLPVRDPARVVAGRRLRRGFLLPAGELATIATLPTDVAVPGLDRAGAKPMPASVAVPTGGRATKPLGLAQVGGHAVALPVADARHHLHVLGATGTGKSTFLTHLILDDIANRRGVVVIDPKGDLAADVLARLPLSVADRLVVIDPDQPRGATLNPLQLGRGPGVGDADLVVDNIVAIFSRIFARHWGPRIDDVLRVACLTLMRQPNATLTLVPPLLNDRQFRAPFIVDLDDPEGLRGFWDWYNTSPPALRAQVIGPVLARLRAFLLRDFVRATLGVPASSFDMTRVLDGGILIARLPKGQLGEDTAKLMGSFVLASVWQAATARARIPEPRRRDASVYIDEAHNVLNLAGSVADMLAEARGYRLSLTLAHQDLAQFPRETVLAISANARNKMFFSCSPEDAHALARHTLPELDEHDLAHLDAFTAAARLVVDSRTTPAFTLHTRLPRPELGLTSALRDAIARPVGTRPSTGPLIPADDANASQSAATVLTTAATSPPETTPPETTPPETTPPGTTG